MTLMTIVGVLMELHAELITGEADSDAPCNELCMDVLHATIRQTREDAIRRGILSALHMERAPNVTGKVRLLLL